MLFLIHFLFKFYLFSFIFQIELFYFHFLDLLLVLTALDLQFGREVFVFCLWLADERIVLRVSQGGVVLTVYIIYLYSMNGFLARNGSCELLLIIFHGFLIKLILFIEADLLLFQFNLG